LAKDSTAQQLRTSLEHLYQTSDLQVYKKYSQEAGYFGTRNRENRSFIIVWLYLNDYGVSLAVGIADNDSLDSIHMSVIPNSPSSSRMLTVLAAWLILSSCLGDNLRFRIANVSFNPRQAIFDRNYMMTVTSSGQGTWNQIEMHDMLGDSPRSSMSSDER
jgi:hypothetical protein